MKAYIYLNRAEDNFLGWQPEHAGALEMVGAIDGSRTEPVAEFLEFIFETLNSNRGYDHRSLSVGDVVLIDQDGTQTAYACAASGWDALPPGVVRVTEVK